MLNKCESGYSEIDKVISLVEKKQDDFDYSLALEYMGNNERILLNIIESFLNYNKDSVSLLKKYLENDDALKLFEMFHHFKGVSLNLGSRIMCSFSEYLCEKLRHRQNEALDAVVIEEIRLYIEFYEIFIAKLESVKNEHK